MNRENNIFIGNPDFDHQQNVEFGVMQMCFFFYRPMRSSERVCNNELWIKLHHNNLVTIRRCNILHCHCKGQRWRHSQLQLHGFEVYDPGLEVQHQLHSVRHCLQLDVQQLRQRNGRRRDRYCETACFSCSVL